MSIRGLNVTTYLQKKQKQKKRAAFNFFNKHALHRMHQVIRIKSCFFVFLTTVCELNPPRDKQGETDSVFALYNLTAMLAFLYV